MRERERDITGSERVLKENGNSKSPLFRKGGRILGAVNGT